ncbi:lantibiotic dehydratase [Belliella marina]|uniref:Lantibiotic dehydratase n=1 Tax=Belliella marina TaxID=1644146 RepID=A0ABW4VKU1_9BACT
MSKIGHFGFFMVRRPLFSYNSFLKGNWKDFVLNDMRFEEAIFWVSPDLHRELLKLKEGAIKWEQAEKLQETFYKYFIRMSSRSTPFGICAGFSVDKLGEQSTIEEKRIITPDLGFLSKLNKSILRKQELLECLDFYKNPSIYRISDSYRFYDKVENKDNQELFRVASIKVHPIVDQMLEKAAQGCQYEHLLKALGNGQLLEDRKTFINSLIHEKLLISELEYGLLSHDIIDRVDCKLDNSDKLEVEELAKLLKRYCNLISILEESEFGFLPYDEMEQLKDDFFKVLGMDFKGSIFHVDLKKSMDEISLSEKDVRNILEVMKVMDELDMSNKNSSFHLLDKFKRVYFERYNNEEMRLCDVLDADIGIGFPVKDGGGVRGESFLLKYIDDYAGVGNDQRDEVVDNRVLNVPFRKEGLDLAQFLKGKKDLGHNLPPTFVIMFSKLPEGKFLLQDVGGGTASRLLSRFGVKDNDTRKLLNDISNYELEVFKETVVAEVIFIPVGKEGNVAKRPLENGYFIPINGGSLSKDSFAILPEELHVVIRGGEIVLFSKKLNKRVVPRLSSAHNYFRSSLPLYQFLCSLQHQKPVLALAGLKYGQDGVKTPRIFFKNVIFKPATWNFKNGDYIDVIDGDTGLIGLKKLIQFWGIPRWIAVKEGDNELPIDTHDDYSLKILKGFFLRKNDVKLIEWLHFSKSLGSEAMFCNQIVLPVKNLQKIKPIELQQFDEIGLPIKTFLPGSSVLSIKIYCGVFSSDIVLRKLLKKLGEELVDSEWIHSYFFVRYQDPNYHLRIRYFLNTDKSNSFTYVLQAVTSLAEKLRKEECLWRLELVTYERELTRYSSFNIEFVERIFYHDSFCILQFDNNEDEFSETDRVLMAMANVDYWMNWLGFDLNKKSDFVNRMENSFSNEFEGVIDVKKINSLHGVFWESLYMLLNNESIKIFEIRNQKITAEMGKFKIPKLSDYNHILPDLIHMSQNRIFHSDQRVQEYIIYILLGKYYKRCKFTVSKK